MAYDGVIIGLDLAGTTGVAEGCPGEVPVLSVWQLAREHDTLIETCARGVGYLLERLTAPRFIAGRSYGQGEAIDAGLIRVIIEAPIKVPMPGKRNADSHGMSLGLYAALGAVAHRRGAMVREVSVGKARKHFIGKGSEPGDVAKRMARMMCEALGWKPPNLDAADAGAVWHWASWQWNPDKTPPTLPLFARCSFDP